MSRVPGANTNEKFLLFDSTFKHFYMHKRTGCKYIGEAMLQLPELFHIKLWGKLSSEKVGEKVPHFSGR